MKTSIHPWAVTIALALVLPAVPLVAQEEEGPKLKDTPYFAGMPNYSILEADDKEFDAWNFWNGKTCVAVEGRKFRRDYSLKEGAKSASELQIVRNYANAIKSMGGTILYEGAEAGSCAENSSWRLVVGKVVKGGDELWAEIAAQGDGGFYILNVVVKEAMKQDVSASALFEAINREGRVALYINFDTGKATIRPDSQPVIDQVAEMLQTNAGLMLSVEGHTDSVGTPASNKILSENRAKAVVAALAAKGIDAKRLTAAGWGQDKPIADNQTEEGRAKNRRVELVKK
ncbi:MAG: OmpA family protein [Acidobacteria bacterium]|nr:OmpA family protein [Acidobacteriota bacterium]